MAVTATKEKRERRQRKPKVSDEKRVNYILTGSNGSKMGKTACNAVWLDPAKTSPYDFYQYWRNVGDADVIKCLKMLTFLPLEQIAEMETWRDSRINTAKEILAFELTKLVHGEEEAHKAQQSARALFGGAAGGETPTVELTEAELTDGAADIMTLLVKAGLVACRPPRLRSGKTGDDPLK